VRIAFAGTPDFAVPSLAALLESGAQVPIVLTQPDRPAGRGRRLVPPPVKRLAQDHGIAVLQPEKPEAALREALPGQRPDVLVVVAYGLILPRWLLDWPLRATINVHASLLPRWRGASPIQQAILAGDAQTGISIMQVEAGLDTGPVYGQRTIRIGAEVTAGELHDRLAPIGAALLCELLPAIVAGRLEPVAQDPALACYAPKISKHAAKLDWNETAVQLARRVRAYNPWPIAEAVTAAGERLRIWRAEAHPAQAGAGPGAVVAAGGDGIDVATGDGVLRLTSVQPSGGRPMDAAAWLAGHDLGSMQFGRA
jgi:methionyl-tRNA formyltransferase